MRATLSRRRPLASTQLPQAAAPGFAATAVAAAPGVSLAGADTVAPQGQLAPGATQGITPVASTPGASASTSQGGLASSLLFALPARGSVGAARASLRRSLRLSGRFSRLPVLVTPSIPLFTYWAALAGGSMSRGPATVVAPTVLPEGSAA